MIPYVDIQVRYNTAGKRKVEKQSKMHLNDMLWKIAGRISPLMYVLRKTKWQFFKICLADNKEKFIFVTDPDRMKLISMIDFPCITPVILANKEKFLFVTDPDNKKLISMINFYSCIAPVILAMNRHCNLPFASNILHRAFLANSLFIFPSFDRFILVCSQRIVLIYNSLFTSWVGRLWRAKRSSVQTNEY